MLDFRETQRRQERKRRTIGWGVCGGMAAIALAVVLLVNGANRAPAAPVSGRPADVAPDALDVAAQAKIDAAIAQINATRSLLAQLDGIESQVRTQPGVDTLRKLFAAIRDGELAKLAQAAGGQYRVRYDMLLTIVTRDFVAALGDAAGAAESATTCKGLAPIGELEDTLRAVIDDATTMEDVGAQNRYRRLLEQVFLESNALATKRFDDAYQAKVQWQDLLGDVAGWQAIASPSFTYEILGALTLANAASPDAAPGGLRYLPGRAGGTTGSTWS